MNVNPAETERRADYGVLVTPVCLGYAERITARPGYRAAIAANRNPRQVRVPSRPRRQQRAGSAAGDGATARPRGAPFASPYQSGSSFRAHRDRVEIVAARSRIRKCDRARRKLARLARRPLRKAVQASASSLDASSGERWPMPFSTPKVACGRKAGEGLVGISKGFHEDRPSRGISTTRGRCGRRTRRGLSD
jgi:hypothetical protein